jgi:hypothetical protein
MKHVFLLSAVLYSALAVAQTIQIETDYLMDPARNEASDPVLVQERGRVWRNTREMYPELPYDPLTGEFVFEQVISFPGVSKAQAFRRCKEWASFNFRQLKAVIDYEDFESGKLIIDGYVNIRYLVSYKNLWGYTKTAPRRMDLEFTLVFTVVDEKAKVTYHNLRYRNLIESYFIGGIYVPSEIVYIYFEELFPVVSAPLLEWAGTIDLIKNSVRSLNATAPSLERYVRAFAEDYRF